MLTTGWEFRKDTDGTWYPADVPSTVHLDLFQNGLISDPFFAKNAASLDWIGNTNWIYLNRFKLSNPSIVTSNKVVELVFEGLDTYTEVWLNGQSLGKTNNFHRTWIFNVKDVIKATGWNNLTVRFQSVEEHDRQA